MSIFATLNNELNVKKKTSALLSVKMTETFADLIEKREALETATGNMLDMSDRLSAAIDSTLGMMNYMEVIKEKKLQPTLCKILSYEVGFESIAGISLKDVTNANRDQLSVEALDGLKKGASEMWKKIKEFFMNMLNAIKKFFVHLFDTTKSNLNAVIRLHNGVLTKIESADDESFNKVTTKFSKAKFYAMTEGLSELRDWLKDAVTSVDGKLEKWIDTSKSIPYEFDGDWKKVEVKSDSTDKQSAVKLGWSPEELGKTYNTVHEFLMGTLDMKTDIAVIERSVNGAIKKCDYMITSKEDNAAKKEELMTSQKNIKLISKGLSIYAGIANSMAGEYISLCSKIKIKGEAKVATEEALKVKKKKLLLK